MKNPFRSKFLCNLWACDDIIRQLKSLSMRKMVDVLECQLALKTLEAAPAKTIIFFLPQLF